MHQRPISTLSPAALSQAVHGTPHNLWAPLAGFGPATRVFEHGSTDGWQGMDAHGSSPWAEGPRDEPGQGDLGLY
jgi:hypothetical protein